MSSDAMKRIRSIRLCSLIEKIFLIFIVVSTGTMLSTDFPVFRYICVPLWSCLFFLGQFKIYANYRQFMIMFLIGAIIIISNRNSLDVGFSVIINELLRLFMIMTYVCGKMDSTEDMDFITGFLFYLSLISNILFLLHVTGASLPFITTGYLGKKTIFFLQTPFYYSELTIFDWRNAGFCWEPGVYQIFLNFLLVFALFGECKTKNRKRIKVFYLCFFVYTTGSITGFALCTILLLLHLIYRNKEKWPLVLPFAALLGIAAMPYAMGLWKKKSDTLSYFYRMNDLLIGWDVFKRRFLFGFGYTSLDFENRYREVVGIEHGNSNGIMQILLTFGGIGFVVYAFLFVKFARWLSIEYSKGIFLPIIIWAVLSLMNEPLSKSGFMYYLLCIGVQMFVVRNGRVSIREP